MDVLATRLVDSWARIGILLLGMLLVALGLLMVRPRAQGRRIPDESHRHRHQHQHLKEHRGRADSALGMLSGTRMDAAAGTVMDAEMGEKTGRSKRGVEGDGLDVEDTCVVQ
ncbi:hypothetical protein PMIN06_002628 [Paraphaeosphaeria minitans]